MKSTKTVKNPLFESRPRNFGIGKLYITAVTLLCSHRNFRSGHPTHHRSHSLRQVARICSPSAPEGHSQPAFEGPSFNRPVQPYPGQEHGHAALQAAQQVRSISIRFFLPYNLNILGTALRRSRRRKPVLMLLPPPLLLIKSPKTRYINSNIRKI